MKDNGQQQNERIFNENIIPKKKIEREQNGRQAKPFFFPSHLQFDNTWHIANY